MTKREEIKDFYEEFHQNKNNIVNRLMEQARYRYLKKILKNQKGNILIVGCGSKNEMNIIPDNVEGWGIDISEEAIERSRKYYPKFCYTVANAEKIPFEDKKFTTVVCSEVIEHVEVPERAITEMYRVLAPQGRLIISTPNWWSSYGLMRKVGEAILKRPLTSDDQPIDHWYTPLSFKNLLKESFIVDKFVGFWYFIPFGKGNVRLPGIITLPIVILLWPLELILRYLLPWFGHVMICIAIKK